MDNESCLVRVESVEGVFFMLNMDSISEKKDLPLYEYIVLSYYSSILLLSFLVEAIEFGFLLFSNFCFNISETFVPALVSALLFYFLSTF